jgi:tRNA (guanine37-N1)-methyltransferase
MKIDVVTIFPAYFDVLSLSLLGKAQESGALDVAVHDLRSFTHDRHRTVDDTPYGGGPGMLMRPEPWGDALDHVLTTGGSPTNDDADAQRKAPLLLVPTPAGVPMTQADAEEWSNEPWLVIACGRYEGIDARVAQVAERAFRVREVSMGDYVLNGGEVAALAIIEAVGRLLPGVVGNAASLDDESHAGGMLEAPAFTKPATWQGLEVPEVLRSGHHGEVARWRRAASLRRTAQVRPDLIAALSPVGMDDDEVTLLAELGWVPEHGRFRPLGGGVAD